MKLLNLVLYSDTKDNQCYDEMFLLTQQYYKRFSSNVKTIYYKFADISDDYLLQDDVLLIKGVETLIPGCIDKTVKAFEYVVNNGIFDDYDAVVRTNISTIVNFDLLIKKFERTGIPYYAGARVDTLAWDGGGCDHTQHGTKFACGISIIFSKDAIHYLLSNKDKIRMDIVDDVSLAIFHKDNRPEMYPPIEVGHYVYMPCFFVKENDRIVLNEGQLIEFVKNNQNQIIFYRNNCTFNWTERKVDAIQMSVIIGYFSQ
jgi:hypothetical protein